MADSSFEDRVREELDKLRLKPEEQVWTNVDAALQQDRKRRWLIWFILFAGLFGSGAVYFLQGNRNASSPAVSISSSNAKAGDRKETGKQQQHPALKSNEQPASVRALVEKTDPINAVKEKIVNAPATLKQASKNDKEPVTNQAATVQTLEAPLNKNTVPRSEKNSQVPEEPRVKPEDKTVEANANRLSSRADSVITNDVDPRAEIAKQITQDTSHTTGTENTSAASPPVKNSKWSWQLFAEPGRSGNRNGFTFLESQVFASSPTNAQSGGFSGGSSTQPPYRDAFSIVLGAQALHPAGKNSSFGISARYALYRVQVGVGKRHDTLVNFSSLNLSNSNGFVYRRSDTGYYTNAYHFAMLNFDYYTHFKLGAQKLRWSIGLGAALLIASNAIHYDANSGLSFQNNALIPGLQWNAGTGIDIALSRQRIFIGPQLTWFFTKNSTVSGSAKHLFNAGVRVGISLNKKKK